MATRPNWGKGRNLKIVTFEAATIAALATAVNAWLVTLDEEEILNATFTTDGTNYQAVILYTEE